MATALNRRGFLARLGLTAGASAVALTGTAIAAVSPIVAEDPALLALGEELVPAIAIVRQAMAAHRAAIDLFHATRPEVPPELQDRALRQKLRNAGFRYLTTETLKDGEGTTVVQNNRTIQYLSSSELERARLYYAPKGAMDRRLKRLQAVAARYQTEDAAALKAAHIEELRSDLFDKQFAMERIGRRIFEIEARTMEGIEIKAGALAAAPLLDLNIRFIGSKWGPELADNLLTVLAGRA